VVYRLNILWKYNDVKVTHDCYVNNTAPFTWHNCLPVLSHTVFMYLSKRKGSHPCHLSSVYFSVWQASQQKLYRKSSETLITCCAFDCWDQISQESEHSKRSDRPTVIKDTDRCWISSQLICIQYSVNCEF